MLKKLKNMSLMWFHINGLKHGKYMLNNIIMLLLILINLKIQLQGQWEPLKKYWLIKKLLQLIKLYAH